VTWDLSFPFKPGQTITGINANTSVFVVGIYDELLSDKVFTYAT
jgi:hypothetical protein